MKLSDLENAVASWPADDWSSHLPTVTISKGPLGDKVLRGLVGQIEENFSRGRKGRAFNWTLLLLHVSTGTAIRSPRLAGVFQPQSRLEHQIRMRHSVLLRLEGEPAIGKLPSVLRSLRSWRQFIEIALAVSQERSGLFRRLEQDPLALHAAAVCLEEAFQHYSPMKDATLDRTKVSGLAPEEVADAVSYLLALLSDRGALTTKAFAIVDTEDLLTSERERIIVDAFRLRQIHEAEASVFRLGHSCERDAEGSYVISTPDERFGMALSFGYLKTAQMSYPSPDESQQIEAQSFVEMCKAASERFSDSMIKTQTDKVRRLVVALPGEMARGLGKELLLANKLYKEDIWQIRNACYELGVKFDDLDTFEVSPWLSLMDLLRVSRVLKFITFFREPSLTKLREVDKIAYLNSVVTAGARNEMVKRLMVFGLEEDKARAFIDLITWSKDLERPLDIQYFPVVDLGSESAVFLSVFSGSNIIRNSLVSTRKRINDDGSVDAVATTLADALGTKTKLRWTKVEYSWAEGAGDIDVFAVLGSTAFAFECKNTILPCSEFEQRTMLDYLEKAVLQLDRFSAAYSDPKFRELLSKRLGCAVPVDLRTGIVLSNRLLSGTSFGGHPVRHVREMANMIATGSGEIWLPISQKPFPVSLWLGRDFDESVLSEYLDASSALYEPVWKAFARSDETLDVGHLRVKRAKYLLRVDKLIDEFVSSGFITFDGHDIPPEVMGGDIAE
jgi:hypothetical protein